MSTATFPALIIESAINGRQSPAVIRELANPEALPAPGGDVLVRVIHSSLNYKDGLAVTGRGKILRQFPIVPGIDLAGVVETAGADGRFRAGDTVVLTGWGIGERFSGGYAGFARVQGDWLLPLPKTINARQAMGIGTAGLTAMCAVLSLEDHGLIPGDNQKVIVSGAAGGVGSMAIALLSRLGHHVVASTGRIAQEGDYLRNLGAAEIIPRETLATPSGKPLDSETWAGGIDTVGGETLASILRQTRSYGSVVACGLAGGANLPTTVMPFILRGVNLLGLHSVMCPRPLRERAWTRLATDLDLTRLEKMSRIVPLKDVPQLAEDILAGKVRGRIVVEVNA